MAHLAETTHVLRVKNRSGNVHDGAASLVFLRDLWGQLQTWVARAAQVRFRMDGAFFREDVLRWLGARGVGYAIKVPFYPWLDLQYIRATSVWQRVAPDLSGFIVPAATTPRGQPQWVAIWKEQADVPHPLFHGYTVSAGGTWPGYIPDLRSAAYGGYGADASTRIEVGAGEKIMLRHLTFLYDLLGMWKDTPGRP